MTDTATLKSWGELPEDIRVLLTSDSTIEQIEAVGAAQGLSIMQQGFLVRICANLMKGLVEPKAFVNLLESELDIPRATAATIAQEINKEIFSGVKESLKMLHTTSNTAPRAIPSNAISSPPSIAPSATPSEPPKSVFEQKLAGAFQMSKPDGVAATVPPKFVMPNFAQPVPPATTVPTTPPQKPAVDPYHELPV